MFLTVKVNCWSEMLAIHPKIDCDFDESIQFLYSLNLFIGWNRISNFFCVKVTYRIVPSYSCIIFVSHDKIIIHVFIIIIRIERFISSQIDIIWECWFSRIASKIIFLFSFNSIQYYWSGVESISRNKTYVKTNKIIHMVFIALFKQYFLFRYQIPLITHTYMWYVHL